MLVFACNKQDSSVTNATIQPSNDSLQIWVEQGKDRNLPKEVRALILPKAYNELQKRNNDSLTRHYFTELSLAYRRLDDSLMFRKINEQTRELSKIAKDTFSEALAEWDLGSHFRLNSIMDSAFLHYKEAHDLLQKIDSNYNTARVLYNIALVQMAVEDYTGAETSAFKAIELLKPLEKFRQLYQNYGLLGSVTKELKEYDRSLEYFKTADEYLKKIKSNEDFKTRQIPALQNNIGNVYKDQEDYKNAIKYYTNALQIDDSLQYKRPEIYARYLINLSTSRLYSGDTLGLKKDLKVAKHIFQEESDSEGLSFAHYAFAEYFLTYKDTVQALHSAELARQFAEQSSNNKRLLASLALLTQMDSDNSSRYAQRHFELSDSLLLAERKARDKFTRIRFETDEVEAANRELARKQQIWIGIALGIFLLGIAVYIIINQRAKNQALRFQQQQQASNQEIFDLMLSQKQKIEESKKMEQKRISEELHDGVLGKMLGARMVLTGLNKRTNEEAIEERAIAIAALKDVEGEVRAISHELSHAAYQNMNNFIHSIQELLGNVGTANNIAPSFEYNEDFEWDSLKGDIKINLYRIVQESLQNAVKHAECKNILVSFVRQNNSLHITINDDGKGFKTNGGRKGIGMRNIESRVSKLNGTWEVNSIVNKGTTITLHIPLNGSKAQTEIEITEQNLQNIE